MDEKTKSKLIMDEDDLAGESIENTGHSFERTRKKDPEFFRRRQPKKAGKVNKGSTVTVVEDSEEPLRFNTSKEHKDSSAADQRVKTQKADLGKEPVDNLETSGPQAKEKKKNQPEQNLKKKTLLRFDDEKPVKGEQAGVLSKAGKSAGTVADKTAAAASGVVHAKIAESEDDNAAVEAAHSTEIAGETSAKLIHSHLKGTKPETARLKFDKSEQKESEIGAYKVNSKAGQKKGIQKTYADSFRKAAKTGETIGKTADVTGAGTSALTRFRRRVGAFVRRNKAGIATLLFCGVALMSFLSGIGTFSSMLGEAGGAIVESTFLSSDDDIYAANNKYLALEAGLQSQINSIERTHPGYDEYRYQVDEITHEPYALISYLTAKYGDFTIDDVQSELTRIFQKQFTLKLEEKTETKTRTVTKTRTRDVVDEETGEVTTEEYEYEVEEQYEWHVLNIKLTNKGIAAIAMEELNTDQKSYYLTYIATLGNRSYLFGDTLVAGNPSEGGMSYEIPPEALSDERFANMIREAEKYLGYPYVWGGSSPETSFDCSGFVCWVINHCGNGWNVGRITAEGLRNRCTYVSPGEAKPGDLICFQGTYNTTGASHVAIYVGNNMMIHCGNPIQYTTINSNYWQQHFYCFGRLS